MAAEQDAFEELEQRIQRAVAQMAELRAENKTLRADVDRYKTRLAEAEAATGAVTKMREESKRLESELATLQKERENVRSRIANLLKQVEALA